MLHVVRCHRRKFLVSYELNRVGNSLTLPYRWTSLVNETRGQSSQNLRHETLPGVLNTLPLIDRSFQALLHVFAKYIICI